MESCIEMRVLLSWRLLEQGSLEGIIADYSRLLGCQRLFSVSVEMDIRFD